MHWLALVAPRRRLAGAVLAALALVLLVCAPLARSECALDLYTRSNKVAGHYALHSAMYNNRPTYIAPPADGSDKERFLYHIESADGDGKWVVSPTLGADGGVASINSWAVSPIAISVQSPRSKWRMQKSSGRTLFYQCTVHCDGADETIHFSSHLQPALSGFYVETGVTTPKIMNNTRVYVRGQYFLYHLPDMHRWMISEEIGATAGLAFVDSKAMVPADIHGNWHVSVGGKWTAENPHIVHASRMENTADTFSADHTVYWQTRKRLSLRPHGGRVDFALNNGMSMPVVGLGTGNLQDANAIRSALDAGYQLIDSASIYGNEEVIGDILQERRQRGDPDAFVITKIWPTDLGFDATLRAADLSLRRIRSGALQMLLIHWPECYSHFEWMDCSKASGGRWQDSWKAMEKMYAEGLVLGIGVSNFDQRRMDELLEIATTSPQMVQNWMDPVHHDDDVVQFCADHHILYQAYSPLRQLTQPSLSREYAETMRVARMISNDVRKTPYQVILRWFVQRNVGIVPRASSVAHQEDNIDLFGWELRPVHMQWLNHLGHAYRQHDEL